MHLAAQKGGGANGSALPFCNSPLAAINACLTEQFTHFPLHWRCYGNLLQTTCSSPRSARSWASSPRQWVPCHRRRSRGSQQPFPPGHPARPQETLCPCDNGVRGSQAAHAVPIKAWCQAASCFPSALYAHDVIFVGPIRYSVPFCILFCSLFSNPAGLPFLGVVSMWGDER